MNGYDLFPSISLIFIDQTTWIEIFPEKDLSFERCFQEISTCGRRLLKGTNRSQERLRLLQLSDQLRDLMREAKIKISMKETVIPESKSSDWSQMLSLLGRHRALHAAKKMEKEHLPHFLPCIWAPSDSSEISSGQSTIETVGIHLQELQNIKRTGLDKLRDELSRNAILEVLEMRINAFKQAIGNRNGVVEAAGMLLNSYLPPKEVHHG